jgi:hypothetical protein
MMILIISSLLLIGNAFESAVAEGKLQIVNGLNPPLILRAIHTLPSSIHVNDNFSIIATMMNNSTTTLMISNNGCKGEPLTASFDKNVEVMEGNHICNLLISPSLP